MIKNYKKTDLGEEFWCKSSTYRYDKPILFRKYLQHGIPKSVHPVHYDENSFKWHIIGGIEKDLVLSDFFAYKREQKLNRICNEQR